MAKGAVIHHPSSRSASGSWFALPAGTVTAAGVGLGLILLFPPLAQGNAGFPMIGVVWPAGLLLLVPVVLVEAVVAKRILGKRISEAVEISTAANVVSTLMGIPLTWFLLVIVETIVGAEFWNRGGRWEPLLNVTVRSPWLFQAPSSWEIAAASASLCIPFYLASVGLEYLVVRFWVTAADRPKAWRWARLANALTYGPVCLALVITAVVGLLRGGR